MRILRLAAAAAALVAVVPASAVAADQKGRGAGIEFVKNFEFPDLRDKGAKNQGTDLEFATITIPQPVVAPAPPAPAVKKPATKKKSTKKKQSAYSRRCRTKRQKRTRWCRREAAKRRAAARRRAAAKRKKARTRDAQPSVPGLQKTFAFVGSYSDGLQIFDVTDPQNAALVATWDCGISQGDVQVFQRPDLDGRWFVTYTHDDGYDFYAESTCAKELTALGFKPQSSNGGAGTYIAEVTDPYNPKGVSFVPVEQGSHNGTVHPSGKYFYNSNSDLITSFLPAIEIWDLTDITKPKEAGEHTLLSFPGLGTEAHDIGFSEDGKRAYVAALSHGEIIDTTDPVKPETVGHVFDPAINVWHQMEQVTIDDPVLGERNFLIAEDEVAGAIGTGQCPNGAVHVYDATGPLEAAPLKVGVWNIDDLGPTEDGVGLVVDGGGTCTAHVFQLHRKEKLMTIAYYNGGVRVVDLTGLVGAAVGDTSAVGMKQLGWYRFADSNTWAVKAPKADRNGFYLYGGDHRRGFDVYRFKPSSPGAKRVSPGNWMTPEQGLAQARALRANGAKPRLAALCLLNSNKRSQLTSAVNRAGLSF